VVLSLVVTGLVGLVDAWPEGSASLCPAVAPGPAYAAPGDQSSFASLAVDLVGEHPDPEQVTVMGVWCAVVVVDLAYAPHGDQGGYSDILRGIDVATGEQLWAVAARPDGAPLLLGGQPGFAWRGKLALLALDPDQAAPQDCADTDVMILDLRTGSVLAQEPLDCAASNQPTPAAGPMVVAYQDSVLVVEVGYGGSGAPGSVLAWRDTDLEHPLWTLSDPVSSPLWLGGQDRVLPGGWVPTPSGQFIRLTDGVLSQLGVAADQTTAQRLYYPAGEVIVQADWGFNTDLGVMNLWLDQVAGWTDATAAGPAWTYAPPPGWVISAYRLTEMNPVVAVTSQAVVIMELRYEELAVVEARVTALGLRDGAPQWSVPFEILASAAGQRTTYTTNGDTDPNGSAAIGPVSTIASDAGAVAHLGRQEFVVFTTDTTATLVRADSGQVVAALPIAGLGVTPVRQCGEQAVCVFTTGGSNPVATTITAIDLVTDTVQRTEEVALLTNRAGGDAVYPTADGVLMIAQGGSQTLLLIA
jgi:hypothetical protein